MTDSILPVLQQHIAVEVIRQPKRAIQPDEPLISSGLINSFHLVDLALFVEDTFGVMIDDAELNAGSFDTLNQLTALIESRR